MPSVDLAVAAAPLKSAPRSGPWLGTTFVLLAVTLTALALRLLAFEALLGLAARLFSDDGEISDQNRRLLGNLLLEIALWGAALGLLAFVMSTPRGSARVRTLLWRDALQSPLHRVPNPQRVLAISTACGVAVIGVWLLRPRIPADFAWVFAKEGALELMTFVLLIASAGLCAVAARHRYRSGHLTGVHDRWIALSYAALGIILFVTGMEEISWGQTYLAWETPASWAAINSQQETTLHNLLDQQTLHVVAQRITYAFVVLMLLAMFLGVKVRHPYVSAVAPHFSTIAIILLIGYVAFRFHLEVSEILFSIFVTCYAWRVYVAARRSD